MKNPLPTKITKVAVVEDHTFMREGLRVLLSSMEGFSIAWLAGTAAEAAKMLRENEPDVLLVDITLPDRNGLEIIKDVRALYPNVKILVLTMHEERLYVTRALRSGARGYLTKDATHAQYEEAIRRVAAGHLSVSESVSEEIMMNYALGDTGAKAKSGIEALSDRELEVFILLGEGKSTHEVAEALRISPKTVDVHKMNMRSKLGVEDGAAITRLAIQWTESRRHGGK
ncbi:MAG: response regulator transcription factor [Verrucomicrobiaceae bacterium]|nr:response regulator transcription factor [Verrucomicrobiaceae bacterium]